MKRLFQERIHFEPRQNDFAADGIKVGYNHRAVSNRKAVRLDFTAGGGPI
ncbi:MAG: hypothetical protein PHT49_08785 [Desulfovibrionales bacterium]|jgi:hypothetical protein|nr:hypothetical protein [Desulfovibrionales bacterium]